MFFSSFGMIRETSEPCWRLVSGPERISNISADASHFPVLHNDGSPAPPFQDRRVLVVQMESRTKKHAHGFLQAAYVFVFLGNLRS